MYFSHVNKYHVRYVLEDRFDSLFYARYTYLVFLQYPETWGLFLYHLLQFI
ncbi:hypothetical protein [Virgibacillus phage Mimir87]|nr:hypothetical protein [Virgibacillus phage Mimir87]